MAFQHQLMLLALVGVGTARAEFVGTAVLSPETVSQFDAYIREAEARIEREVRSATSFLWSAQKPERLAQVRAGKVLVEGYAGGPVTEIQGALIHDWIGAVFIPGTTLGRVLSLVQDYDAHKRIYQPEVIDSRLLSHHGDDFRVYLRLRKRNIITVVLNTEHWIHYVSAGAGRCYSRSYATRIAEVQNPGTPEERELPPGRDHGILWRLNSYWRFEEREGGVFVECEAIGLSRSIPQGFQWLILPFVQDLPKESLAHTLSATRAALQ